MKNKTSILIIEDEAPIRQLLRFTLEPADFEVQEAENTELARLKIKKKLPDLILVDWMLPGESGIEFIKQLKNHADTHSIPIILLTARAEENNKLQGFEVGADDYITKPFSPRELIARIKSVLRRGVLLSPSGLLNSGELQLNTHAHEARINNELLNLSPLEYQLLLFFVKHPNKAFTRAQLLNHMSADNEDISDRSIDAHIRRLRKRLKPHHYDECIQTVRGTGYQFILRNRE